MFEAAEIDHEVSQDQYEREMPALREQLLDAQLSMLEKADKAVIVIVAGVEGAGKGDTINLLQTWLDPRHAWVFGFGPPDPHEARFPRYKRFWSALPPKGRASVFFGSWYTQPIVDRVFKRIKRVDYEAELFRIRHFEEMLADEGYLLLKLWFHLSKKEQKARFRRLQEDSSTRWRVTKRDLEFADQYDRFYSVCTHALRQTSTDAAPWTLVAGAEPRYRHLTVGRAVLGALQSATARPEHVRQPAASVQPADGRRLLDAVDLTQTIDKDTYREKLEHYQGKLALAVRRERFAERGLVVVFEGWDAAGKGGAIRRITSALDARAYRVKPIAAPSDEERARPYLWRFWRNIPPNGKVTIFDRSWYGRVLVERVEGFASGPDISRAYTEINDFEAQLTQHGLVLCKFWLHIDADEQLRRFDSREQTGFKRHKLTDEDWRNRDKWQAYEEAVHDMVERTSSDDAPWTVVAANDKRHARIEVLRTLVERLEE